MTKQNTQSHTDPFSRKYKILSKIGEGSYSEVLKCKNRETGAIYACKRLKHCYRSWNQVNDIPEIVTLRKLARHPNILQMVEIHFDPTAGRVSLVFELMDMNLYELIKDRKRLLPESRVRVMMFQLMRALRHLHKHGIFHRDVKPENILLKNDLLKLGDLGSVRGLYSRPPYTEYISTRWYRSPECLLTCGYYSFKMDVWAAGCVFYEILTLRPLFPGSSELDQINRVHNVLGPPPSKILQKFSKHAEIERDYSRHTSKQARLDTIKRVLSEMKNSSYEWYFSGKEAKGVETLLPTHVTADAKDLLKHLLQYDPDSRPSSHRALQHAYFKDLREQAQRAARSQLPSTSGPIVTIVGDEGGLEVAADDNANPVDLTTLGDSKLKLKAPIRRGSEIKDTKESISSKSKNLRKESSGKISYETSTTTTNTILKEAGEIFSREPVEDIENSKKLSSISSNNNYEPRRTEERVKLVQRTMANLRFGGDTISSSQQQQQQQSLPYQKIYLGGADEEEDGDGPSPKILSKMATVLEEKKKNTTDASIVSKHLNRPRGGSKIIMEVERKKSLTIMSQSSSGRGFPLDFIDKTSITPDVLVRINENRRIAHMQPIVSTELKKVGRESQSPSITTNTSHKNNSSGISNNNNKDLQNYHHHNNNIKSNNNNNNNDKLQQQKSTPRQQLSSPPPRSPMEFSPRNYQRHQTIIKNSHQKPLKGDHNQIYNSNEQQQQETSSHRIPHSQHRHSHQHHSNNDSHPNTNKQVRELLASLPAKKKIDVNPSISSNIELIKDNKDQQQQQKRERLQRNHPLEVDCSSKRTLKSSYSKNIVSGQQQSQSKQQSQQQSQRSSRNKYEPELNNNQNNNKGIYFDHEADLKNLLLSQSPHTNTKKSQWISNTSNNNSSSRKEQQQIENNNNNSLPKSDRERRGDRNNNNNNMTMMQIPERKDRGELQQQHYERHRLKHQNSQSGRQQHYEQTLQRNLEPPTVQQQSQRHNNNVVNNNNLISSRLRKNLDTKDQKIQIQYSGVLLSGGTSNNNKKSYMMEDGYDSVASLSPTNIRRVIENRRRAELVTTDTDGDGDNYNQSGKTVTHRKLDSSRRKRRSRFSTDSNPNTSRSRIHNNNNDPVATKNNVSEYSPRSLVQHHHHHSQQQQQHVSSSSKTKDDTNNNNTIINNTTTNTTTPRLSAATLIQPSPKQQQQHNSHSISSSSANKQVREILAEMRKRRDMLEDKVTKEPTLQNWKNSKSLEQSLTNNNNLQHNNSNTTTTHHPHSHHHSSTNPNNTTNNSIPIKTKSKLSESMLKKQTTNSNNNNNNSSTINGMSSGRRGGDINDSCGDTNNNPPYMGSTTYRYSSNINNNNKNQHNTSSNVNSTNRIKPSHGSHAELITINRHSDKLSNNNNNSSTFRRRQAEEQQLKIGRQPSMVKYLESEARLIKPTIKSSTDTNNNNNHNTRNNFHQTGAGSQAFPRNRHGSNLHNRQQL